MPLRLVFGSDDLQRVRIAEAADSMWELVLSLPLARESRLPARYASWYQYVHGALHGDSPAQRWWLNRLFELVPRSGNFPDFLTPPYSITDIDAGCEAVACTSTELLRRDMESVFAVHRAPAYARLLAVGDREEIGTTVAALRRGHSALVAPVWGHVRRAIAADRTARTRQLVRHGVGAVLGALPGVLSWDGTMLSMRYPLERTVDLRGRGITLVPSFFCWDTPVTFIDDELPPVLVYSAETAGVPVEAGNAPAGLLALLGRTRGRCLRELLVPHTTSSLATRVGITAGAASKHAAVLRAAGLIDSVRSGSSMLHQVTDLGTALLDGQSSARVAAR